MTIMITTAAAITPTTTAHRPQNDADPRALQLRPGLRMMQVQSCCNQPVAYVLVSSLDFSIRWTHCTETDHPVTWAVWCRDCDHPTMIIEHADGSDSIVCGACYRASTEPRRKTAA